MAQDGSRKPLSENVGYVLKQAQMALHNAMDRALRSQGLTVSQYSVLELLSRTPGQTNAQLARGAFVTAQSMNDVLRGLQSRGLVDRPSIAASGRSRPTHLTAQGEQTIRAARQALQSVDLAMDAIAEDPAHEQLLAGLRAVIAALEEGQPTEPDD